MNQLSSSGEPLKHGKNAHQSPCGYQVLGLQPFNSPKYLLPLVQRGDKLQHLICSFSIPAPFFTFTLEAVVSAVTLSPYYPPFLLILHGTFPLLLSPPIANYLPSCFSYCFPSWSIMEVQLLADGDWDEQRNQTRASRGVWCQSSWTHLQDRVLRWMLGLFIFCVRDNPGKCCLISLLAKYSRCGRSHCLFVDTKGDIDVGEWLDKWPLGVTEGVPLIFLVFHYWLWAAGLNEWMQLKYTGSSESVWEEVSITINTEDMKRMTPIRGL